MYIRMLYYKTDKILGAGAYSQVYLGYEIETQNPVAIKIGKISKKAINVLETIKTLQFPHLLGVTKLLSFKENTSTTELYLEFVKGEELYDYCIDRELTLDEIKKIFKKLCQIVELLHSNGIIHLDIKLENIMYDHETQKLTLVDFGFAQNLDDLDENYFRGSTHYVCPEFILRRKDDPKKADVWSLGIVLYAMFFKRFPFDDVCDNKFAVFEKIKYRSLSFPQDAKQCDESSKKFIAYLLNKDPETRPSIEKVLEHEWFN